MAASNLRRNIQYSEDEIIEFFKDAFFVSLCKEHLNKPSSEIMAPIFQRFLAEFGVENLHQPDLTAIQGVENIERFEEFISYSNLCRYMASLLENVGFQGFCFGDILYPKKKRNQVILSQLITIWIRHAELKRQWEQIEISYQELPNRRKRVEDKTRELRRIYEEKSLKLSALRNEMQPITEEMEKSIKQFEEKQLEAQEIQEEQRLLKLDFSKKNEQISELAVDLGKMKEEIFEMEQKVISSPMKIVDETENKEKELDAKRSEKRKLEKEYLDSMREVENCREIIKGMRAPMETLNETFKEVDKLKEFCSSIDDIKQNQKCKNQKHDELKVMIEQNEVSLTQVQQQINRSAFQHKQRVKPTKEMIQQIKTEIEYKNQEFETRSKEEKKLHEEELLLEKRISDLKLKEEKIKEYVQEFYSRRNQRLTDNKIAAVQMMKQLKNTVFNINDNNIS